MHFLSLWAFAQVESDRYENGTRLYHANSKKENYKGGFKSYVYSNKVKKGSGVEKLFYLKESVVL